VYNSHCQSIVFIVSMFRLIYIRLGVLRMGALQSPNRIRGTDFSAVLSLLLFGSWFFMLAYAQESHCDPRLQPPEPHPHQYQLRGDRCEGVYIQEVASTTLHVASLTEVFEDFQDAQALLIEWHAPDEVPPVHLRAQGVQHRFFYRMDTVRPGNTTSYTWPLDVLRALDKTRRDIGIVGWARYLLGDVERTVYLPLRISRHETTTRSQSYSVGLLPGVELHEIYLSLAAVSSDGELETFLRDGEPLNYGYYPAGRLISIPISSLSSPGFYYLEIGAELSTGGSSTLELWLYHSGQ
jgi:hypothetical protein